MASPTDGQVTTPEEGCISPEMQDKMMGGEDHLGKAHKE
jgi:hypothetical protein